MNTVERLKVATTIFPQLANNTTVNGTGVEVAPYRQARVLVTVGATDVAFTTFKIQESDDNSAWSDVTGGEITGSDLPAADDDNKSWAFTYNCLGGKRYVRCVATVGNATGANICANVLMADGDKIPANATEAGLELNVNC